MYKINTIDHNAHEISVDIICILGETIHYPKRWQLIELLHELPHRKQHDNTITAQCHINRQVGKTYKISSLLKTKCVHDHDCNIYMYMKYKKIENNRNKLFM